MSSQIIYDEKENFLKIKYSGYENIEEFNNSLEKAFKICKEKNFPNIILDIFEVNFDLISFTDKFIAGEKIAELFNYPSKIAVLAPRKSHDRFAEDVATNRGANIRSFIDIDKAIEWLNE